MSPSERSLWVRLLPPLTGKASRTDFATLARKLARRASDGTDYEEQIENTRRAFVESVQSLRRSDRSLLLAAGLVITDLAIQGWRLRIRRGVVEVCPPAEVDDQIAEKERIRRQELVKRDAQLQQSTVKKFVHSMERTRVFDGKFISIFSLMRDGRELAEALRQARVHSNNGWANALAKVIDPYLQFVGSEDAVCPLTGLRLMDIWRYFRHTWTNQYTSVPGRSMLFLVRDRAASFHPIVGIGALSSPIVQIRERDMWIGWHADKFKADITANPTQTIAEWLVRVLNTAISEIYIEDFIEDGILSARHFKEPDDAVVERLLRESIEQRRCHYRYVRSRDHKAARLERPESEHWAARARTHLFRSKRALALASYLRARSVLNRYFGQRPTAAKLVELVSTRDGIDVIRKILKKAKADRIGIAVADISVCGAVQPYNAILGGKLMAMLAASPEVVAGYRRRYLAAESEIASAMAGKPIVRTPNLVLLGTTSLYGVGSSQYNRIKIPCERLGGREGETIKYEELGHSKAFGTSQYSEETLEALSDLVQQSANGQRVNSIFGEGVSPKLRKVRQALDLLQFPSDALLRHHRRRIVYAVSLLRNLQEYLLGIDPNPDYFIPNINDQAATEAVAGWWRERWLRGRIQSEAVLDEVARHTLVRPIHHGARVVQPPSKHQRVLFPDLSW